jgi:hypothetical protein
MVGKTKKKTKRKPGKRDTIVFAAILRELKGTRYCIFLHDHGIRPRWEDATASTYPQGYQAGNPWRKKIQDEKTRATLRMNDCSDAELAEAFCSHLPAEFDELSPLLHSRNSRRASKNQGPARPHKY